MSLIKSKVESPKGCIAFDLHGDSQTSKNYPPHHFGSDETYGSAAQLGRGKLLGSQAGSFDLLGDSEIALFYP